MHPVRRLREHRGWTQQHLADAADLSRKTVVRIENGAIDPTPETLLALAGALDVPVHELRDPTREWERTLETRDELRERLTSTHDAVDDWVASVQGYVAQHSGAVMLAPEDDPRSRTLGVRDPATGRGWLLRLSALRDVPDEVKAHFKRPAAREAVAMRLSCGRDPFAAEPGPVETRPVETLWEDAEPG